MTEEYKDMAAEEKDFEKEYREYCKHGCTFRPAGYDMKNCPKCGCPLWPWRTSANRRLRKRNGHLKPWKKNGEMAESGLSHTIGGRERVTPSGVQIPLSPPAWYVYLVECSDGTLYCGCTNDLERRVIKHNAGKGAKYTRSRRPVRMLCSRGRMTKSEALRLEAAIKKLPRRDKLAALENP